MNGPPALKALSLVTSYFPAFLEMVLLSAIPFTTKPLHDSLGQTESSRSASPWSLWP